MSDLNFDLNSLIQARAMDGGSIIVPRSVCYVYICAAHAVP